MIVRGIEERDAAAFLNLCRRLDSETNFMMYEPDERTTTVEQQRESLDRVVAADDRTILVAEEDGGLVGFLGISSGAFRRNKHAARIVLGVLRAFARRGVGTALMIEAERWARRRDLRRLELTVMTHNRAGLALYEKMGYEIEGTKKDSLLVDGSFVDEYYMAKLLD